MTVWFDVEDLFQYLREGHARMSGIQRLTFEIYRAADQVAGTGVGFVRHGRDKLSFSVIRWVDLAAAFRRVEASEAIAEPEQATVDDAPAPAEERPRSVARRLARHAISPLPERVRGPLVLGSVLQIQVMTALARFGMQAAMLSARLAVRRSRRLVRRRPRQAGAPVVPLAGSFEALAAPGDVFLVLGSPWFRQRYSEVARWLRDERRMRFGVLVHDLVPLRRPEWSDPGVTRNFKEWYGDVLPFCDVVLANSRHTAADVEAYAREIGVALPRPVRAVPVGTGFGAGRAVRTWRLPAPGTYVLFVSTMEARKNHELMVRVWRRLLAEVAAGARAAATVPELVFAGRIGWQVADLVQQLENTEWLRGRIVLVQAPSDGELRALYEGCLFTVFPSFHEGWGLPVTESLAAGKPCLVSNAAALPEAGGALCRYFDPEDVGGAFRAVAEVLDDRPGLAAWEARVRAGFHTVPWTETARVVLDEAAAG